MQILELEVKDIIVNPGQPRKAITKIDELAASMKEIGQITPISVCELSVEEKKKYKTLCKYMLANGGERRLTAARKLGWKKIKVIVEEANVYAMLAENMCREELHMIEKAEAIEIIFKKKHGEDWKQKLSKIHNHGSKQFPVLEKDCLALGVKPTTVYLWTPVLKLSARTKKTILENKEYFTEGVVRKMCGLSDERLIIEVADKIVEGKFNTSKAMKTIFRASLNRSGGGSRWEEFFYNWSSTKNSVFSALRKRIARDEKIPGEYSQKFAGDLIEIRDLCDKVLKLCPKKGDTAEGDVNS